MGERLTAGAALRLLADLENLEARGRLARRSVWFPLLVFGVVDGVGALLALVVGRDHLAPYFIPATVAAGLLSVRSYRRLGHHTGLQVAAWPWLVVILAANFVAALCSATGQAIGSRLLNLSGPGLAHVCGFTILAFWARSTALRVAVSAMVMATLVAVTLADGDVAIAVQLAAYGVIMGAAAMQQRYRRRWQR
jgi:hypothetical protein